MRGRGLRFHMGNSACLGRGPRVVAAFTGGVLVRSIYMSSGSVYLIILVHVVGYVLGDLVLHTLLRIVDR